MRAKPTSRRQLLLRVSWWSACAIISTLLSLLLVVGDGGVLQHVAALGGGSGQEQTGGTLSGTFEQKFPGSAASSGIGEFGAAVSNGTHVFYGTNKFPITLAVFRLSDNQFVGSMPFPSGAAQMQGAGGPDKATGRYAVFGEFGSKAYHFDLLEMKFLNTTVRSGATSGRDGTSDGVHAFFGHTSQFVTKVSLATGEYESRCSVPSSLSYPWYVSATSNYVFAVYQNLIRCHKGNMSFDTSMKPSTSSASALHCDENDSTGFCFVPVGTRVLIKVRISSMTTVSTLSMTMAKAVAYAAIRVGSFLYMGERFTPASITVVNLTDFKVVIPGVSGKPWFDNNPLLLASGDDKVWPGILCQADPPILCFGSLTSPARSMMVAVPKETFPTTSSTTTTTSSTTTSSTTTTTSTQTSTTTTSSSTTTTGTTTTSITTTSPQTSTSTSSPEDNLSTTTTTTLLSDEPGGTNITSIVSSPSSEEVTNGSNTSSTSSIARSTTTTDPASPTTSGVGGGGGGGRRTRTPTLVVPPTTTTEPPGIIAGAASVQATEATEATTNVIAGVAGAAGAPGAAMTAGRAISIPQVASCTGRNAAGQRWTETQIIFPRSFLPASMGFGPRSGFHIRSSLVSIFVLLCVVGVLSMLAAIVLRKCMPSILPPTNPIVVSMVMTFAIAQVLSPIGELCGMLLFGDDPEQDIAFAVIPIVVIVGASLVAVVMIYRAVTDSEQRCAILRCVPSDIVCVKKHDDDDDDDDDDDRGKNKRRKKSSSSLLEFTQSNVGRFLICGHFTWSNPEHSTMWALVRRFLGRDASRADEDPRSVPMLDKLRWALCPYAFPINVFAAIAVAFATGVAKASIPLCHPMLWLIAVINLAMFVLDVALANFAIVPVRGWLNTFLDLVAAVMSVTVAVALGSEDAARAKPGVVRFVNTGTMVAVLVGIGGLMLFAGGGRLFMMCARLSAVPTEVGAVSIQRLEQEFANGGGGGNAAAAASVPMMTTTNSNKNRKSARRRQSYYDDDDENGDDAELLGELNLSPRGGGGVNSNLYDDDDDDDDEGSTDSYNNNNNNNNEQEAYEEEEEEEYLPPPPPPKPKLTPQQRREVKLEAIKKDRERQVKEFKKKHVVTPSWVLDSSSSSPVKHGAASSVSSFFSSASPAAIAENPALKEKIEREQKSQEALKQKLAAAERVKASKVTAVPAKALIADSNAIAEAFFGSSPSKKASPPSPSKPTGEKKTNLMELI